MGAKFDRNVFYGHRVKGCLNDAILYIKQFSELTELYNKYISVFEKEQYPIFEADAALNEILIIYQKYYREVFYLDIGAEKAMENTKNRFAALFNLKWAFIGLSAYHRGIRQTAA